MDATAPLYPDTVIDAILGRTRRFWLGEGRCLATCTSQASSYRQVEDEERMLDLCAGNLAAQAALPGDNLPTFLADFGTISTARPYGGRELRGEGGKPHLEPVASSIEEALAVRPRYAVEDPLSDTSRAIRLWRIMQERHGGRLWMRSPDMQGALTTAALVMEQTAFMTAMIDHPEQVHSFLAAICDRLVAFQRHLRSASDGRINGNIWPWVNLPEDLGIVVTEDYMPLLSPGQYRTFGIPYLRRLADAFGGALIHCCGRWGRHAAILADSGIAIRAVEYHHPYTTVAELEPLAARGVVLVPYLSAGDHGFADTYAYYRWLVQNTAWRYAFAMDDSPAAQDFARELAGSRLTAA